MLSNCVQVSQNIVILKEVSMPSAKESFGLVDLAGIVWVVDSNVFELLLSHLLIIGAFMQSMGLE